MSASGARAGVGAPAPAGPMPRWWALAALVILGAALRLSTLDLQSFWYDEAFTPVHVLHASLSATLRSMVHTENSPPLWYLTAWADSRVLGTGEVALRLPSALAGVASIPVAWAIGRELASERAAVICAAITAVDPLFVWYSQEARAYGLLVLVSALAMLCFLRAERDPTPRRTALFALAGALALLTHYFTVFLLLPMVLVLLVERRTRRAALPAIAALTLVGLALLPLISAQGAHGTQWIGRWPLSERLQAIPQYFLTGVNGAPLGHGVELLIALPLLAAAALGLWRIAGRPPAESLDSPGRPAGRSEGRAAALSALILGGGVLVPVALAAFGADYLAPRNVLGAMVPLSALIAVLAASPGGRAAGVLASTAVIALLAISIDVELSPRLQRGNWRGLAAELRLPSAAAARRAVTTVELGSAPLEYYLPGLRNLRSRSTVLLSEIDETGYSPLRSSAGTTPVPGFKLRSRVDVNGLILYRFIAPTPAPAAESRLRRHVITLAHPEVLVTGSAQVTP